MKTFHTFLFDTIHRVWKHRILNAAMLSRAKVERLWRLALIDLTQGMCLSVIEENFVHVEICSCYRCGAATIRNMQIAPKGKDGLFPASHKA